MIAGRTLPLFFALFLSLSACSQDNVKTSSGSAQQTKMKENSKVENEKMRVEVWSDIVCPFCYIGKKNFESALSTFPDRQSIEVVWKSYQLSPGLATDTSLSVDQYLARHKGISLEEAGELNAYVTGLAAKAGLTYRLDKAVVANSLRAHRFLHLARQYGRQNESAEKLFMAYFTEGKNIDDTDILVEIGASAGLEADMVKKVLDGDAFTDAVRMDQVEAESQGVQGVPYFRFNNAYSVSGAMQPAVFRETMEKSYREWKGGMSR